MSSIVKLYLLLVSGALMTVVPPAIYAIISIAGLPHHEHAITALLVSIGIGIVLMVLSDYITIEDNERTETIAIKKISDNSNSDNMSNRRIVAYASLK